MEWEVRKDVIMESAGEGDMLGVDTLAPPGRCRNSCASYPPCGPEDGGLHAEVEVVEAARDRCQWSLVYAAEAV